MIRLALAVAALLLASTSAAAQTPLAPEQRVRVVVAEGGQPYRTAATVVEVGADSVLLQIRGTQRSVALADLSQVEISRGNDARSKWAAIGALAGTALGYGFSLYDRNGTRKSAGSCSPSGATCDFSSPRPAPYPTGKTVGLTVAGTLVGALAGAFLPADRWQPLAQQGAGSGSAALPPPPPAP